jgi:hypothetical protein
VLLLSALPFRQPTKQNSYVLASKLANKQPTHLLLVMRIIDLRRIRELGLKRHQTSLHFARAVALRNPTLGKRTFQTGFWSMWMKQGLVGNPETVIWMIQWCALVMGASWDTSTTAILASPPSSCAAFRRKMWLLWWSLSTGPRCVALCWSEGWAPSSPQWPPRPGTRRRRC